MCFEYVSHTCIYIQLKYKLYRLLQAFIHTPDLFVRWMGVGNGVFLKWQRQFLQKKNLCTSEKAACCSM